MDILTQPLKNHIPGIVLILSTLVAWLMLPVITGVPMVAFAIFFIGLSLLIYVLKKRRHGLNILSTLAFSRFHFYCL